MEYFGIESKINPEHETNAIFEFLNTNWDISVKTEKSITNAIDYVLQAGINYGIALEEKEVQEAVGLFNPHLDSANKIEFDRITSNEILDGPISSQTELVELILKQEWNISATPKDYETFKQIPHPDEFISTDDGSEFNGAKLTSKIGHVALDFTNSLKKENIFHCENQNRSPLTTLVGAIYRQGVNIGIQVVNQKWGTHTEIYKKGHQLLKNKYL